MQSSIECPVCFDVYAPGTRPPKVLTCGHGVCTPCVGSLLAKAGGSSIDCPVCRTKCEIPEGKPERLPTIYQILDLIDTLCGDCRERPHTQRCGHCPLNLCDVCREAHLKQSSRSSDLMEKVKELKEHMDNVNVKICDDQVIQVAQDKGDCTKERLNKNHKELIHKLNAEHEKRIASVDADVARHTDMVIEWREKARQLVTDCTSLLDRLKYSKQYKTKPDGGQDEGGNLYRKQLNEKIDNLKAIELSLPDTSNITMSDKDYQECHLTTPKQVMSCETQTEDIIPPPMLSQHTTPGATLPPPMVPDYSAAVIKATFDDDMEWPIGVCIDPITGNVVVTDYNKDEVLVLSTELELVHKFGARGEGDNQYNGPEGVVATGESLYISDCDNRRIHVCNVQGKNLYTFGSKGRGREDFDCPSGLSVDRSGNIYVCDGWNKRVKVVDKYGTYIREFGSDILDDVPYFITISADDVVAVTTDNGANIYLFTTEGRHLKTIRTRVPPHNIWATGVTFDGHGHLLVTDYDGGRVAVMTESGDVVGLIGSPGSGPGQLKWPEGLAVTRDGDVVVCDRGNSRVVLFGVPKKAALQK